MPAPAVVRSLNGLYSDVLHKPWATASAPIPQAWLSADTIERRSFLSHADFIAEYEEKNIPVILTDQTRGWASVVNKNWTPERLLSEYGEVSLEVFDEMVGPVEMQLDSFIKYCTDADGLDENPLYLFEPDFLQKHPKLAPLAKDYAVPQAFSEDLFSLLGEEHRPDYKWMLVGGRRTGAPFHQDPNATAAWNAVVH
eukprot:gene21035-3235_t